jgi:hypothetical protein
MVVPWPGIGSISFRQSQDRVEINFDNFHRARQKRDDEDLNASWAGIIRLRNYEYDPVRWAAGVESGIYRSAQPSAGCHVFVGCRAMGLG